jgi:aryl-alcohol dehydrogenase-like predicted oxidoreductase
VDTINLQHTDLCVSRICFGAMTFGGQTAEPDALRIFDRCLDAGINFFDTANVYNKGASETIVGKALKGRRDRIVLASKGGVGTGLARDAIAKAAEESLRRLGTDYLDIYYMHLPDRSAPIEESLEAMDRLVQAGKVRYPASSNYAAWDVVEMLWIARERGYKPDAWITQPMYNLLARGIEQEYLPMCRRFGVSTVVYNPLAGGLLTGKQRRDAPLAGTRFDKNDLYLNRYWYPAIFDAVDELKQIAAAAGRSMVSLSMNWLLHHTEASAMILGSSRIEQVEENLKAAEEGPLDSATVAALDSVWMKLKGVTPKYNRG